MDSQNVREETSRTLAVPGATLHVVEVGTGRRPLVLLHGGPGASHDYLRPQLDALLDVAGPDRRLVYFDQRGGGRSPLAPGQALPTVSDLVDDLERLRLALGEERLELVGYSFGGLLALLYALAHPERVARLGLIAPASAASSERPLFKERLAALGRRPEVAALRAELAAAEAAPGEVPATAPRDRRARFALAVSGYFVDPRRALGLTPFLVQQRIEESLWQSLGEFDLRPELTRLHLPTVVVHGEEDPIPIDTARATAAALGAELVAIPHCGHVPFVEGPEPLFAALGRLFGSG